MTVSFEGIGENVVTFYNAAAAASKAAQGDPVRLSAAATVAKCADGERFCGVAVSADEDFAGVLTQGYVRLACSGTLPAVGYAHLAADGNGGVRVDADMYARLAELKALRAKFGENPPFLFCTTETEMSYVEQAIEFGAQEFIMKPFDDEILMGKFAQVGLL